MYINKSYINDNQNLNAKIIKFSETPIEYCQFNNVNISCYEPQTCKLIYFNDKQFDDAEAHNVFKICTKENIDEVLSQNIKEKELNITKIILIVLFSFILFLSLFFIVIYGKRNNNKICKNDDNNVSFLKSEISSNTLEKNNSINN